MKEVKGAQNARLCRRGIFQHSGATIYIIDCSGGERSTTNDLIGPHRFTEVSERLAIGVTLSAVCVSSWRPCAGQRGRRPRFPRLWSAFV
jgi:hypothetical protein